MNWLDHDTAIKEQRNSELIRRKRRLQLHNHFLYENGWRGCLPRGINASAFSLNYFNETTGKAVTIEVHYNKIPIRVRLGNFSKNDEWIDYKFSRESDSPKVIELVENYLNS